MIDTVVAFRVDGDVTAKPMAIILDAAQSDAVATVGFQSNDVDADYARLLGRGAVSLEALNDKPFGVRRAHIKGPGSLTIEVEGL